MYHKIVTANSMKMLADVLREKTINRPLSFPNDFLEAHISAIEYASLSLPDSFIEMFASSYRLSSYGSYFCFPKCTLLKDSALAGIQFSSNTLLDFPNCVEIGDHCFSRATFKEINLPICKKIGTHAFYSCYCYGSHSMNFPECIEIGQSAFCYHESLTISIPKCQKLPYGCFRSCSIWFKVFAPECSIIEEYAFANISKTRITVSFPKCIEIKDFAFYSTSVSLYLMGSQIVKLGSSVFDKPGETGQAKIYVPSSLYNRYIKAENWSKCLSSLYSL